MSWREKVVVCLVGTSGSDDDERPEDEHGRHHGNHAAWNSVTEKADARGRDLQWLQRLNAVVVGQQAGHDGENSRARHANSRDETDTGSLKEYHEQYSQHRGRATYEEMPGDDMRRMVDDDGEHGPEEQADDRYLRRQMSELQMGIRWKLTAVALPTTDGTNHTVSSSAIEIIVYRKMTLFGPI